MRASGILMHISSLPSPWGIGTFGREAYAFADFLAEAKQKYWQILPLGPTGYGDSPYQTGSAFAGNPYFIDLDALCDDGLLHREEIEGVFWGDDPTQVDYGALFNGRAGLLRLAYRRGWERDKMAVDAFRAANAGWLEDYALFTACKQHFGMKPWTEWEDRELRLRSSREVLDRYAMQLRENVDQCVYTQFLFFRQWEALRSYVHEKGIKIIGDVPIYVPLDSADVWAEAEFFQLDDQRRPIDVAGVPPDYFTADGQLWGNPLYDWEKMRADGFAWWIRRMNAAARLYDVVRIDHFRGLESYWAVPAGDDTARNGRWKPGPGKEFITAVKTALPDLPIIAEDLGFMTDEVRELREFSGFPGMKILQFAFDPSGESEYLPFRCEPNSVCYFGTHDNITLGQWLKDTDKKTFAFAREYLGLNRSEGYADGLLRGGMGCPSDLFIAQMQDWLVLGAESRMNSPGLLGGGNWRWRMKADAITPKLTKKIARMTEIFGR